MLHARIFIKSLFLLFLHFNIHYSSPASTFLNISMQSVNMKHILLWSPLQVSCATFNFTVQFQGEYELHKLNGTWVDAYDCHEIRENQCDLTSDLASDSDYNIRVMTNCDKEKLLTRLPETFNRKYTELLAPEMTVVIEGDLVQVGFSTTILGMTVYMVSWSQGNEQKALTHVIKNYPYHFPTATHPGEMMCFRAEVLVEAINKSCSIDTQCIKIGKTPEFIIPISVSIAVVVVFALAIFLGCSATCLAPHIKQMMCHRETLPSELFEDWPSSSPVLCMDVSMEHTDPLLLLCQAEVQQ